MRGAMILLLMALPLQAMAEDWQALAGQQIASALTSRTLGFPDGAIQDFAAGGILRRDGATGRWRVTATQYCALWPADPDWTCYSVERESRGLDIRFTDEGGSVTVGRYIDLQ